MSDTNISISKLSEEFMRGFNEQKDSLLNRINKVSVEGPGSIEDQLSQISTEIQSVSKSLHDAVMFLPSYSVKIRQNEIRDLERLLKEKEESLIPKKRFGFKAKMKQPATKPDPKPSEQPEIISMSSAESNNYFTIEKKNSTTIVHGENELNNNDVLIRDLEDCVVVLEGAPSTLRLANLTRCKLICGPVRTSVFVDKVTHSSLYLCCQQLRTHSSEHVDVYLRVASRAIIEDCSNIRFGPYQWDNEKSEKLHSDAGIDQNLLRYDAVDDFNWLSSTPSPNWTIIPDSERKCFNAD